MELDGYDSLMFPCRYCSGKGTISVENMLYRCPWCSKDDSSESKDKYKELLHKDENNL